MSGNPVCGLLKFPRGFLYVYTSSYWWGPAGEQELNNVQEGGRRNRMRDTVVPTERGTEQDAVPTSHRHKEELDRNTERCLKMSSD